MKKPVEKEKTAVKKAAAKKAPSKKSRAKRQENTTIFKLKRTLGGSARVVSEKTGKVVRDFNAFAMGEPTHYRFFVVLQRIFTMPKWMLRIKHRFVKFLLTIFLIFMLGIAALTNSTISVQDVTISIAGLPEDLEGYVILQMSDLHGREFGHNQATLLRSINNSSYNLVVFTGDMVGSSSDPQPFYDLLDGMTANRKTFFIAGDSDPAPLLDQARDVQDVTLNEMVLADWVLGAQERGAIYLSSTTAVEVGSSTLWLSPADMLGISIKDTIAIIEEDLDTETDGAAEGIIEDYNMQPMTQYRYNQMNKQLTAAKTMNGSDLHIALSHIAPTDEYFAAAQSISLNEEFSLPTADIMLCGHYCGGGWRIPGIGALYVPNTLLSRHGWFPVQSIVQGTRTVGSTTIYTSPGLSVTDDLYLPKFRLFNEPTITLIHLTATIDEGLI